MVAFRKRYGEEDWLVDIDARLTAAPTIDGGTVYVPDWSGRVHALSVWDGSVQWSQQVGAADGGRTFTEPVAVLGDTFYLGSQSGSTGNRGRAMDHDSRWRQSRHRDSSGGFHARIGRNRGCTWGDVGGQSSRQVTVAETGLLSAAEQCWLRFTGGRNSCPFQTTFDAVSSEPFIIPFQSNNKV
ncbi:MULTISPECIES: PQQ-binding-like beta-propeller repeat protein [unclassified Haloferax]|uniref:outer membrane protein assembly factor BamB family protein n=1 Tax=unclassified Haloferax TaxID=2625095 RepID=UPI003183B785